MAVSRAILISLFIIMGSVTSPAQSQFTRDLIAHLNEYKESGKLLYEKRWFTSRITGEHEAGISSNFLRDLLKQSLDKLRQKLSIRYIRLNEQYHPADLNIFIVDPAQDPRNVLERARASGNAVSFPQVRLIIVDETMLNDILSATFSVSSDPGSHTDFLTARTSDGRQILSPQLLMSIKGVQTPAIVLTSELDHAFVRLKTYTGFLVILHEIGHVYHQHQLHSSSYFSLPPV